MRSNTHIYYPRRIYINVIFTRMRFCTLRWCWVEIEKQHLAYAKKGVSTQYLNYISSSFFSHSHLMQFFRFACTVHLRLCAAIVLVHKCLCQLYYRWRTFLRLPITWCFLQFVSIEKNAYYETIQSAYWHSHTQPGTGASCSQKLLLLFLCV